MFNIETIQELQSFTTKNEIKKLLILNDRRILTHQKYYNENGLSYKLCVYSAENGFICDINIDFEDIYNFYQMDDGNIIIGICDPSSYEFKFNADKYQIIKIKKNSIEEIWK